MPDYTQPFGNTARNNVKTPAVFETDFGLHKNFPITEGRYVQFRAEAFNLLNKTNFATVSGTNSNSSGFGVFNATFPARQLQIGPQGGVLMRLAVLVLLGFATLGAQQVKVNEIQLVGTHNSYHSGISPNEMANLRKLNPRAADSLEYRHPALETQLNDGVRQLEIDIYGDAKGGLFAHPQGPSWRPKRDCRRTRPSIRTAS